MTRAQIARELRELADAIERGEEGPPDRESRPRRVPRPASEVRVDEVARAKARRSLARMLSGQPTRRPRRKYAHKRRHVPTWVKARVIARDGMTCRICGGPVAPSELHLDHHRPWSKGGKTTVYNLRVTHAKCNMAKGADWP